MSAKDSSWRAGLTVLKKSATGITVGLVWFSAIVSIIEGMSKQCQSCGMPLISKKNSDCRGLEKDGSKSNKWCQLCYADGDFIEPDCTLNQMRTIVDDALKQNGSGRIMRWMAQKQLPRLERWK